RDDLEGARRAGLHAALVDRDGEHLLLQESEAGQALILRSLEDLPQRLAVL
ncbi:MAG: hypothetical protein H0W13_09305, partial [Nitrospirales bacterium]|nr:hypothetical protein [Nitrospirales bacterium]